MSAAVVAGGRGPGRFGLAMTGWSSELLADGPDRSILLFTKSHAKHIGSAVKEVRAALGRIVDGVDVAPTEAAQKGVMSLRITGSSARPQELLMGLLTDESGFTHCGRCVPVEVSDSIFLSSFVNTCLDSSPF